MSEEILSEPGAEVTQKEIENVVHCHHANVPTVGDVFRRLTFECVVSGLKGRGLWGRFLCECGRIRNCRIGQVRHGNITSCRQCTNKRRGRRKPISCRFWKKVNKSGSCWEWTGARTNGGYGKISHAGKVRLAHHVAWEMENESPVPEGFLVRHTCDNPRCVRASHLTVGTQKDNMQDRSRKIGPTTRSPLVDRGLAGYDADRFWMRVDRSGDCWIWNGARKSSGYGHLTANNYTRSAHRMSWEITNGEIPKGMCVLHKCDNRACVKPSHLFLGTRGDNARDMAAKGRVRNAFTERNSSSHSK